MSACHVLVAIIPYKSGMSGPGGVRAQHLFLRVDALIRCVFEGIYGGLEGGCIYQRREVCLPAVWCGGERVSFEAIFFDIMV